MMRQRGAQGGAAMRWPGVDSTLRSMVLAVLGALLVGVLPQVARAQQPASSAELTRTVGRVEILRKGQTQWIPAVIGAQLVEGDDIRAFSGASAELTLPDTSTVVLAENSRLLLTRLQFDRQNQSRLVLLHLAVGKLRATVAQAAIALVRARQSNFAISTPTAVAAARGTILWVQVGQANVGGKAYITLVAVEPERGVLLPSRVDCLPLPGVPGGGPQRGQTIFSGGLSTNCAAPVPIPPQFLTFNNPATANDAILAGAPVVVPLGVLETVLGLPSPFSPTVAFGTTGAPASLAFPTSLGADVRVNLQESQNAQLNIQPLSLQ
jgi:hypothetical protein